MTYKLKHYDIEFQKDIYNYISLVISLSIYPKPLGILIFFVDVIVKTRSSIVSMLLYLNLYIKNVLTK